MKNAKASANDWQSLQRTLVAAGAAKDSLLLMLANRGGAASRASSAAPGAQKRLQSSAASLEPFLLTQFITDSSLPGLALLQSTLSRIVDWEASKERGQLSVQPGIDTTLDDYRRTYEGI